eukprot:gene6979-14185_t
MISAVIFIATISYSSAWMISSTATNRVRTYSSSVSDALRSRHSLRMSSEKEGSVSDKLVFDPKSGRFFERNINEICDEEFCLVDSATGEPILLTREEKERVFLDSIQTYYITGKPNLSDSEFDKLREDLSWEGSALVTLNRNETLFLNAMGAATGISFDELKELQSRLQPHWQIWDPKKIPTHLTNFIIGKKDDIPNVWIPPDKSVVLQLKCSELVPSNQFSCGVTCRYQSEHARQLPEVQNFLLDYPLPITISDKSSSSSSVTPDHSSNPSLLPEYLPAASRPLVHVFLIQESMSLEALDVVIDSLSNAIKELHDDMEVMLVTYSNRIGIYRFRCGGSNGSGTTAPTTTTATTVAVQYVQLCTPGGRIFDGHDIHEVGIDTSGSGGGGIVPLTPLSWVADFRDTANAVGDIRSILESTISSLYNCFSTAASAAGSTTMSVSFPAMSSQATAPGIPSPSTCQVMTGPVLEAITSWILREYRGNASDGSGHVFNNNTTGDATATASSYSETVAATQSGKETTTGLYGLLSGLTSRFMGLNVTNGSSVSGDGSGSTDTSREDDGTGPIDSCCGVVLHLIMGSAQDIPLGLHRSVVVNDNDNGDSNRNSNKTTKAATSLGYECSSKGLSINIWAVSDVANRDIGLQDWSKLSQMTGGKMFRVSIHDGSAAIAKSVLTEQLSRVLTSQQAMKCLLKIRASSILDLQGMRCYGNMVEDSRLPGIFRSGAISQEDSVGFFVGYNSNVVVSMSSNDKPRIIIQMAFSYETLAESEELINEYEYDKVTVTEKATDTDKDTNTDTDTHPSDQIGSESQGDTYEFEPGRTNNARCPVPAARCGSSSSMSSVSGDGRYADVLYTALGVMNDAMELKKHRLESINRTRNRRTGQL